MNSLDTQRALYYQMQAEAGQIAVALPTFTDDELKRLIVCDMGGSVTVDAIREVLDCNNPADCGPETMVGLRKVLNDEAAFEAGRITTNRHFTISDDQAKCTFHLTRLHAECEHYNTVTDEAGKAICTACGKPKDEPLRDEVQKVVVEQASAAGIADCAYECGNDAKFVVNGTAVCDGPCFMEELNDAFAVVA